MTENDKEELQALRSLFDKLRPFIILAIDSYYTGTDRDKLKQTFKTLEDQ